MGFINSARIGIKKDTIARWESELTEYQQLHDVDPDRQDYIDRIEFLEEEIAREEEKLEELEN